MQKKKQNKKNPDIAYTHDAEKSLIQVYWHSRHVLVFIHTLVIFPILIASIKLATCKICNVNLEAAYC